MSIPFFGFNKSSGLLFQFIFASLMVLALSGLSHLSMVIVYNTEGNGNRYLLALVYAFSNGLIIMVSIMLVQRMLKQNNPMVWKYLTLNACIVFLNYWMIFFIFYLLAKQLLGRPDNEEILYTL